MSDYLHIVCLDAPSPPDYGGAIDMFYKVKALAQTGRKIILHYFDYHFGRDAKGLEEDCVAIYAYKRKSFWQALPLSHPFIVQSRSNKELIKRLNEDDHPILLEGLHCSGIIPFLKNPQRVVLRMHNDEAAYYRYLAKTEKSFFKRLYFQQESSLLKRYQLHLTKSLKLACLSESDEETLNKAYSFDNVNFVPCFIPWQRIAIKRGQGDYCLYHGNMSVSENEEAALWLTRNVFSKVNVPLIIAGKGISKRLVSEQAQYKNVSFVHNPSISAINELIKDAQINVLPSMNGTGVKLKLLNALLNGRHCITNAAGVKGSRITTSLTVTDDPDAWIQAIKELMKRPFNDDEAVGRKAILNLYNNAANAENLNSLW